MSIPNTKSGIRLRSKTILIQLAGITVAVAMFGVVPVPALSAEGDEAVCSDESRGPGDRAAACYRVDRCEEARRLAVEGCNAGSAWSCAVLGYFVDQGKCGPVDKHKALALYGKACDEGWPAACEDVAAFYFDGIGVPKDLVRARQWLDKGCRKGEESACDSFAFMAYHGEGGPVDMAVARRLWIKACEGGASERCLWAGGMLKSGEGGRVDLPGACRLLEIGCDGMNDGCCSDLANVYSDDESPETQKRVLELRLKACEIGNFENCALVGRIYYYGIGVPVDFVKSRVFYQKACDGDPKHGCGMLAYLMIHHAQSPEDGAGAPALYEKGCNAGCDKACFLFASDLLEGSETIPVDLPRARHLFEDVCFRGFPDSCLQAATMAVDGIGGSPDPALARKELAGCLDPGLTGCLAIYGKLLKTGLGGPADPESAKRYLDRACQESSAFACHESADLHLRAGASEFGAALAALKKSCELGNGGDCSIVADLTNSGRKDALERDSVRKYYEKACDSGVSDACLTLVGLLENGSLIPTESRVAYDFAVRSCSLNNPQGCISAGLSCLRAESLWKDYKVGLDYLVRGCSLGLFGSCYLAALVMEADSESDGFGLVDKKRARELHSTACNGGYGDACESLARMMSSGAGGDVDFAGLRTVLLRGCEIGNANCCSSLGYHYLGTRTGSADMDLSVKFSARGCDFGSRTGCGNAAWVLFGQSDPRSESFGRRGCYPQGGKGAFGWICYNLGSVLYYQLGRREDSIKAFSDSCLGGDSSGCVQWAAMVVAERPDQARAAFDKFFQDAARKCEVGNGESCLSIADWYLATGNVADESTFRNKGRALMSKKCSDGDVGACAVLKYR